MTVEHQTIITEVGEAPAAAPDSSTGAKSDQVPTDTTPSAGDKNTEGKDQTINDNEAAKGTEDEAKAAADKEAAEKAALEAENARFDKHPRFQELIKTTQEQREQLAAIKAQNELLSKQITTTTPAPGKDAPPTRDYGKEIADLSAKAESGDLSMGEILPKMTEIIQAQTAEQVRRVSAEQEQNIRASTLEQQFLTKNPDFIEVVQSGKLAAIKQADPLQDDFTAYQTFKRMEAENNLETKVQEAVEKAKKETEEQILKNIRAKGAADTLGEGPIAAPVETKEQDPRMKNPKKYGGKDTVLAQRAAERRAKREAGVR